MVHWVEMVDIVEAVAVLVEYVEMEVERVEMEAQHYILITLQMIFGLLLTDYMMPIELGM